ncbi:V-type ATP synthase subunit F [Clostridium polynesiense]|uniref:V-type ATP synthase subunit F n=1 Tax=Clostridium polynesiense TaxID=1325933 RepID=UPI00058B4436|nr:V-type ATP synthase subunit F [Clostridium polynesiense]
MRAFIISDNTDSLVGMKIAGINGIIAHSREEVINAINHLKEQKDIGIIIITEVVAGYIPEELIEMKLAKNGPLIVEIPDRHGSARGSDYIAKYMKESIGLKI